MHRSPYWTRRQFLTATAAVSAGTVLAACGSRSPSASPPSSSIISATDPAVAAREAQRRLPATTLKTVDLAAAPLTLDLAGRTVQTIGYNGAVPGPPIRVRAGDEVQVRFRNQLTAPTIIHWHGLAIRNDMDGVPDLVQPAVPAGGTFTYQFIVPDPGTYWFHPHMGLDLDRGLYAPFIVDDPNEPGGYDHEEVIVLDDWLDGIDGASPESIYTALRANSSGTGMGGMDHSGMGGMGMGASSTSGAGAAGSDQMMGGMGDFGDVTYPLHLINGRPPADPPTIRVAPGSKVRLRLINAGSDTTYRVAIGGRPLSATHLDGFPIEPTTVDALLISMGERIDVVVEIPSGVWPLMAVAEGKTGNAIAWIRTTDAPTASTPTVGARLTEHDRKVLDVKLSRPTAAAALPAAKPDQVINLSLTGSMSGYQWGIDGQSFDPQRPLLVSSGQRIDLRIMNQTMMVHPMHLHGHTFAVGTTGVRKDTILVRPMQSVQLFVAADNPGQWMLHCHNTYHLEAGMATLLAYRQ